MLGEQEAGNETYIVNLLRGLKSLHFSDQIIVGVSNREKYEALIGPTDAFIVEQLSAAPVRRMAVELPRLARKHRAEMLLATYSAPPILGCKTVVIIHDVSFRRYPEWFSFRDRLVLNLGIGLTVKWADGVVTISNFSKREIQHYYGIPEATIKVIHLAAAPQYGILPREQVHATLRKYGIQWPYILAVGNIQPRKNLPRLVSAYVRFCKDTSLPHKLVLVGKAKWQEGTVSECIQDAGITDRVMATGYVPDEDLVALYNGADLFVYPSLFEGFGLPVLEAMACGVAVVTSNIASIPEVAGQAAILINPLDVDVISTAMRKILSDPSLAHTLREAGCKQARLFSWTKVAQELMDYLHGIHAGVPQHR
ncbi:MAG: glycosyltransferase family 1 protein [Kiritimatiellaeota bacterium]|nr:glycosyltransferase family 1 protein [Kiritimatiellota bacterium]